MVTYRAPSLNQDIQPGRICRLTAPPEEPCRKPSHNASQKRATRDVLPPFRPKRGSRTWLRTHVHVADAHLQLGLLLAQGRLFQLLPEVVEQRIVGRQVRTPIATATTAGKRGRRTSAAVTLRFTQNRLIIFSNLPRYVPYQHNITIHTSRLSYKVETFLFLKWQLFLFH